MEEMIEQLGPDHPQSVQYYCWFKLLARPSVTARGNGGPEVD